MTYEKNALMYFCVRVLRRCGASAREAGDVAEALTAADARGVHSHGCVRIPGYAECLQSGGIRGNAAYTVVSENAACTLIDAGQGLGIPVSVFANALAMEKARTAGVAVVNVRNSHHHGACGYYTLQCARAGMIGMAMSTGDIIMAATGAAENSIGNNPFSYAAPAGKYGCLCYDVAMSTVAMGKVAMAADEGRAIPLGWMLDRDGVPTTDPWSYANGGTMVPFGGHKGYGLAVMVELLAGILSGAALLGDIHAWNRDPDHGGGVGHCFLAIDPSHWDTGFSVSERVEQMIESLRARRRAPGVQRICFPGELEQEREAEAARSGLSLPPATEHALARAAALAGLESDWRELQHGKSMDR